MRADTPERSLEPPERPAVEDCAACGDGIPSGARILRDRDGEAIERNWDCLAAWMRDTYTIDEAAALLGLRAAIA